MPGLWIARLDYSERTRVKVATKHGLDVDDLRAHLVGVSGLPFAWPPILGEADAPW